jgi:DNA ligase-1
MKDFAEMFQSLDETTKTSVKTEILKNYFGRVEAAEAAHAIYFLLGNKLRPRVPTRVLRNAAIHLAAIPEWLFEETYQWVGDLAETIAAVVPPAINSTEENLTQWIETRLSPLLQADPGVQQQLLIDYWMQLDRGQRFVFNKLITGNFRVGVSDKLITRALSDWSGVEADVIAHRLMGGWVPSPKAMEDLLAKDAQEFSPSRPYPFCLAHAVSETLFTSESCERYIAEWKWDGIRAQMIRRQGEIFIWSRGEELLNGRFPEVENQAAKFPNGTVLDGEILAWRHGRPLPFAQLQRRIQRKKVGVKLLAEVPVVFLAFDLLEWQGTDLRHLPLDQRRDRLTDFLRELNGGTDNVVTFEADRNATNLLESPIVQGVSWDDLARVRSTARELGAEGLMLKDRKSRYEVGRVSQTWWKWKLDPYSLDAVLLYAQRGHGRRAALYTDYTFAIWSDGKLVPFAKAYSGLDDAEIKKVDRWIRENTIQKFGPVHEVKPFLVMEVAFENVQHSSRHKSGVAVRFPRIVRIRDDKRPEDADSLEGLKAMIRD